MPEQPISADAVRRAEADREHLDFFRRLTTDGNIILGTLGFGIRISRETQTLAFDHKTQHVLINPEFIERKRLSESEKRYVFGHEIAHFVQLVQNPDVYLETFEDAARRSEAEEDEGVRDYVRKAWDRFYNVFLDVHDNAIVDARSMWTQSLSPAEHPRHTLYEKFEGDLRGQSRTEQFNFAVLKYAMTGKMPEVDDDVAAVLSSPFKYAGRTYADIPEFVKEGFFDPSLTLGVWMSKLRRTMVPVYERLLRDDLAEGDLKPPDTPIELSEEGLDWDAAKRTADSVKRAKESAQTRAQRAGNEHYEEQLAARGFSEREITEMQGIRERTMGIYPTAVDLWDAFLRQDVLYDVVQQSGYRTGENFDVDAFVRELPTLLTRPDDARFMERSTYEQVAEHERPKRLELHLILDLSGSMDAEKRRAVQDVSYSLMRSLLQYRTNKNMYSERDEAPLRVNIREIGFGSTTQDLLVRREDEIAARSTLEDDSGDVEARLARGILNISSTDLGGTADAPALESVVDDIGTPDITEALEQDDAAVVVIEITDGETQTAPASALAVRALNAKPNVFARAIQIPGPLFADQPRVPEAGAHGEPRMPETVESTGTFESVWGKYGEKLESLGDLKSVLLRILFAALFEKKSRES